LQPALRAAFKIIFCGERYSITLPKLLHWAAFLFFVVMMVDVS